MVTRVVPGSGWEAAGVKPGDIVIECDGSALTSQQDLSYLTTATDADGSVVLRVNRKGTVLTLTVRNPAEGWSGRWVTPE